MAGASPGVPGAVVDATGMTSDVNWPLPVYCFTLMNGASW